MIEAAFNRMQSAAFIGSAAFSRMQQAVFGRKDDIMDLDRIIENSQSKKTYTIDAGKAKKVKGQFR